LDLKEPRSTPPTSANRNGQRDSALVEIQSSFTEQLTSVRNFAGQGISNLEDMFSKVIDPVPIVVNIQCIMGLRSSHSNLCCAGSILGGAESDFQTKAAVNDANVWTWNEFHELPAFGFDDKLQFRLIDRHAWPIQDNILGEATLSGSDIFTAGFGGVLKLSNGLQGLELHVTIVRLGLTYQHAELRKVALHCCDVEKVVNDAKALIENMSRQTSMADAADGRKSQRGVSSSDLVEYRDLLHKFEENFQTRIRVLELASADLASKIRGLHKQLPST